MKKHFWLYVLKLENDKWYIGITTKSPEERFREHAENVRAAAWTRVHKPLSLHDVLDLGFIDEAQAKSKEDNTTLECMRKYGVNNVRGGSYTEIVDYVVLRSGRFYRKDVWYAVKTSLYATVWFGLIIAGLLIYIQFNR